MEDPVGTVIVGLLAGFVTGVLYFTALRATVDRMVESSTPFRLALLSALLRGGTLAVALVGLARWRLEAVPLALLGLLAGRAWVIRRVSSGPSAAGDTGVPASSLPPDSGRPSPWT